MWRISGIKINKENKMAACSSSANVNDQPEEDSSELIFPKGSIVLSLILQSARRSAVMSQKIINLSSQLVVVGCSDGPCLRCRIFQCNQLNKSMKR